MRQTILSVAVFSVCLIFASDLLAQRRIIELEIVASRFEPLETQQRWMKMLQEVGADRVRSKTSRNGTIKVTESEMAGTVRIKVQGAIDQGKLVLPGGKFTIRQKAKIAQYLDDLRDEGANVALAEKKAFGLTSVRLVEVNEALKAKLNFDTKGEDADKTIRKIVGLTGLRLQLSESARRALARDEKVLDELNGFSAGTALAALARPVGLVMVPGRDRGSQEVTLRLIDYRDAKEFWPIGWPAGNLPISAMPEMHRRYPIEIVNAPLNQALKAVKARAKVPMLFDYNSMAIAEIDINRVMVTYVKEKVNYSVLLSKILNQAKPRMDYEVRLDENAKPFLWLSTANPVK